MDKEGFSNETHVYLASQDPESFRGECCFYGDLSFAYLGGLEIYNGVSEFPLLPLTSVVCLLKSFEVFQPLGPLFEVTRRQRQDKAPM
jgi:hypothetical protein